MNDAQIAWIYLNQIKDKEEKQQEAFEYLNWIKWFINPEMAQKYESMQEGNDDSQRMSDDSLRESVTEDLRERGFSEDEIHKQLRMLQLEDQE